jgi:hypothetical protein
MSIIVKFIEGEEIRLKETEVSYYTSTYYLIWIFILILAVSSICFITLANDIKNEHYGLIGGSLIVAFIILGMTHLIIRIGVKWKPAYKIYLRGEGEIIIEKRTKEADQIAICNAVQRLEPIAKTIAKNKRELKQISEKCK